MKITGKIDKYDLLAWINWMTNNSGHGQSRWKVHLFVWPGLVIPPIVFWLAGTPFSWETYCGVIFYWLFYFILWRFVILLIERRRAKNKDDVYFEMIRENDTVRLHVKDRAFELPAAKLSTIRLKSNLIIALDKIPFCITPRNGNIDEGKTIEDILKLITDAQQSDPPHQGVA